MKHWIKKMVLTGMAVTVMMSFAVPAIAYPASTTQIAIGDGNEQVVTTPGGKATP